MVFVYWDNSNIYHEAQRLADEREGTPGARYLVRVLFDNLLRLAHADRPVTRAVAAGSIPPEMQQLWNRMENRGIEVNLFDRGARDQGEQGVPDQWLQLRMLEDGLDHNGDPGIVVLLTGDGAGYAHGRGFHRTLERMHGRGWGDRSTVLGPLVQPRHASLGGNQRGLRPARRLLRRDHVPRTVPARLRTSRHRGIRRLSTCRSVRWLVEYGTTERPLSRLGLRAAARTTPSVVRSRGGQVQPLQRGESLLDLSEFDFDDPEPVIQPSNVSAKLGEVAAQAGHLDAQRDGRGENGPDDPLSVSARHGDSITPLERRDNRELEESRVRAGAGLTPPRKALT